MADQIGITGSAFQKGIPAATISWTTRTSGTPSVTIYNDARIRPDCDVAKSYGNSGEWLSSRRRNKRWNLTVTTKPAGATSAAALAICKDPPMKGDKITIASHADTRLNHGNWVLEEPAEVSYTPENEATMTLNLVCYWDDDDGSVFTMSDLT